MAVAMIGPKFYAWDKNGDPLAFGKLYTYEARTNVPKDTYQSEDQVVPNTNPVILNGEGYANVYLSGSYKMVLKDSDENEVWSADPVTAASSEEWVNCRAATYVSPTSFKITGNVVGLYDIGRRVRLDDGTPNYVYATIKTSIFASGETTINVAEAVVKVGLINSCASIVGKDATIGVAIYPEENVVTMTANTMKNYVVGDVVRTKEFSTNDLGGSVYDVVLTSTVTPNARNIIVGVADSSVSFVQRKEQRIFDELTTATMVNDGARTYVIGDTVRTKEFSTGKDGGALYDVVDSGTVTANGENIIVGVSDPSISFVLRSNSVVTPQKLGKASTGAPDIDNNVIEGGFGEWDTSAPVRTPWDAKTDTPDPSVNDLNRTGHYIHSNTNSAIIVGGRPAYYSYVDAKGSLSWTNGGDNYNGHLAGVISSYHCDLQDDDLGNGSHGAAIGGSFKNITGDYSGSFAGTIHEVHGLQSVIVGGKNNKIGTQADATIVRRSAIIAGDFNGISAGEENAIIAGKNNTATADGAIVLGGDTNTASNLNAIAKGKNALADLLHAEARSCGQFSEQGDNQVYDICARRTFTGLTGFLSLSGGSSGNLITPAANTTGILELNILGVRTDSGTEMASYKLLGAYSNQSGTLIIKGTPTVTVIHEDDAAYNVAMEVRATNTQIGVRLTTPSAGHTTRWTASGSILVLKEA